MASLEDILAGMDKKDRGGFSIADQIEIKRLETPSIGLTESLNGGWAMGRQNTIWGSKSAGKSTFAMQQIAIAQREGMSCAYFDVEGTFDKSWSKRLGVDTTDLLYVDSKSMNNMIDKGAQLMKAGIDVMIVDSITALIPPAYEEKDGELKSMDGMGAMGALARGLSIGLPALNKVNDNTLLLLVSQSRSGPKGGMNWGLNPTGGQAVTYYSTAMVKMFSGEGDNNTITGSVTKNNMVVEKSIGRKVHYTVQFNKSGPQGGVGEYDLYYEGDFVGIDQAGEVLDLAVKYGIIKKGGSWYSFNDESLGQGREKVAAKLREDEALLKEVRDQIGRDGQDNEGGSAGAEHSDDA